MYLSNDGEFFVGVEVQFVLSPSLGRNINVICPVQTDRTIQLLWTNDVSVYMKPRAGEGSISYTYQTQTLCHLTFGIASANF